MDYIKQDLQLLLHKIFLFDQCILLYFKYQFNALLFKSQDPSFGCMSSLARVWATGPKCKKIIFRS